jgi:hypothetical protein
MLMTLPLHFTFSDTGTIWAMGYGLWVWSWVEPFEEVVDPQEVV